MPDNSVDLDALRQLQARGKNCPISVLVTKSSRTNRRWVLQIHAGNNVRLLQADFAERSAAEEAAADFALVLERLISTEAWRRGTSKAD